MTFHNKEIPQIVHPDFKKREVPITDCGEPLINLGSYSSKRIIEAPMYDQLNVKGALSHCYVRESIIELLEKAARHLPSGYQFVIWDGYRPYQVQKAIYDQYFKKIKKQYPEASHQTHKEKTEQFVSFPSVDPKLPAPHITGGAIDITIQNNRNKSIDFGTEFDDFSEVANTAYYEKKAKQQKLTAHEQTILENRRFLYQLLTDVGFTNYHQEWWHFDYGNPWWAQKKEKSAAIYGIAQLEGGSMI